jgi:hypothetical protein
MSFVPKDITTLSTVLSNTLDLASFIVSSIFSNVAPEIEAFMQFGDSSLDDVTERKDTSGQADSNPTTDDNNSELKFILSKQVLLNIYLTFIRPVLEYACEVWDGCYDQYL